MIRRTAAVFTAILALALGSGAAAVQAAPAAYKSNATKEQVADAKLQVAAAHIACDIGDIRYAGSATTKVNGKSVETFGYEVSCTNGGGYFIQGVKGGSPDTASFSCISLASLAKEKKGTNTCEIPANKDLNAAGQAFVARAGLNACKVEKIDYFGTRSSTKDAFYEVACSGDGGYVLKVVGSVGDSVEAMNCLKAHAIMGFTCKLVPEDRIVAPIAALAATTGKSCAFSKTRYVVTDPKTGLDYYEIACVSGSPGYMLAIDKAGAMKSTVDCAAASYIAGGCTLTDAKVLQAAADSSYSGRLKAAGIRCDYQKARLIGQDTRYQRDVVEYACADRPTGLIVAFAGPSGGKQEVLDCVAASRFATHCQFTEKAAMMAQMTKALAASGKTCTVSDFAYLGSVEDTTFDLEVACQGAPGLVVEMLADYSKVKTASSCVVAARQGVPCTLPANK